MFGLHHRAVMTPRAFRLAALALVLVTASATLRAQTAPGEIAGHKIRVPGEKADGTTQKLSEVEAEIVARLPPQGQAERLLQYAISHQIGATDEIELRVKSWRGVITRSDALATLMEVAITDETLPDDARQWRTWYASHGAEATERFRKYELSRVP